MDRKNPTPHGGGVRGLNLPRSSLSFDGNFGRIFRALAPAEFGSNDAQSQDNLKKLAGRMVGAADPPKDGADPEESGLPALYTYLGQFIDHDLTFDPASSLQQQNDIDGLIDYRTPRFDLDCIYGRGPDDQPYLYQPVSGRAPKLLLGSGALTGGSLSGANAVDLARNGGTPARAIIGDPRNDENIIVSQLQGLFLRFHNRLVDESPAGTSFEAIQHKLRFHYQWMLVHDFLPSLVNQTTLHDVFPHLANGESIADSPPKLRFYHARNDSFMPLEFSVAAYRFGHSMVRPGYRLNDADETLLPIFGGEGGAGRPKSLRGFMPPLAGWGIDWARFIDIEDRDNGPMLDDDGNVEGTHKPPTEAQKSQMKRRLQLAYRLDTSVVKPLSDLPPDVADLIVKSLIERNLLRGWRLRLPNGQSIARAMGEKVLESVPIGQFLDGAAVGQKDGPFDLNKEAGFEAFRDNCPLWVYVLAETMDSNVHGKFGVKTKVLGPVGGRIVAETFAGLLHYDSHSFLNLDPRWKPASGGGRFGLKEFVRYALGK